jgi:capsular polysaccharide export protein
VTPPDQPLLAIPPFPGAKPSVFATRAIAPAEADIPALLRALALARVGGCYWGEQPDLPDQPFVLDGSSPIAAASYAWSEGNDPWYLLARAKSVVLPAGDPRILLALAAGRQVRIAGSNAAPDPDVVVHLVEAHLTGWRWRDPFTGDPIGVDAAIALAGFWRTLIDANRPVAAAMGFAYWKRPAVAPLLWGGRPVNFARTLPELASGQAVAIWRSRLSAAQSAGIARLQPPPLEVEDGFIRSTGLGADCVPPLSVIVDGEGVHFDPNQPSTLERLLQHATFPPDLLARANRLRQAIVSSGLSKYERGEAAQLPRPGGNRRHVLVPGQVEDDRAVTSGGALPSNLELLRRARAQAGLDAFLIYKPHPDVLAGHRRGRIANANIGGLADHVETTASIAALIDMVDELHVNSSLAGFEALLREKPVTVHGVPFYAGWGLTDDHGPVPARRTARRSIDELVAAALLLYPRYLDPLTGIPCPAEVLVQRLTAPKSPALPAKASMVITARKFQGKLRSALTGLRHR